MKFTLPFVSAIIPCRNEEKYIGKCLDSIIANDYPKEKLEILVIDGMSTDKTREVINKYPFVKLVDNPNEIQTVALNIGIRKAKGEIIMRMDAHTIYSQDYISKCVKYLLERGVDNVGGICVTEPGAYTYTANGIAFALSSSFGVGNAYFRIGTKEIKEVDTVPFGCYKKEIFAKIGLFDEELVRCQDDEFNYRLRENEGKILLVPEIKSYYYARNSLKSLWHQYFRYGFWKVRVFQKHPRMMQLRQFIPVIFVFTLLLTTILSIFYTLFLRIFGAIILCYLAGSLFFSFKIAHQKGWRYFPIMPIVFSTLHISYGLGFLIGLIRFIKRWKK